MFTEFEVLDMFPCLFKKKQKKEYLLRVNYKKYLNIPKELTKLNVLLL